MLPSDSGGTVHAKNLNHRIGEKVNNMSINREKPLNTRKINEEITKFSGHKLLEQGSFALNSSY